MGDYYTKIFGEAPKAGTVIPGEGTVLEEVVVTPKRPRKYRFDRRTTTVGPGYDVISETLYDEFLNGQYMGDLSGVAGQRTIYVTPFGNDTIYGRTRNWQGGEPNRWLEYRDGFMEVAPDRKNQARRKRQFKTNLKSSHVSPNSSKDEKSAFKRAIKEKRNGGNLSKPTLTVKAKNGGSLVKYQNPAGPLEWSPVDTRSDTTRRGYHEGNMSYGRDYQGPLGVAKQFLDTYAKDHNPNLTTGTAPVPGYKKGVLDPVKDSRYIKWLEKRASGSRVTSVEKMANRYNEMVKGSKGAGVNMDRYNNARYPNDGGTWKQVGKSSEVTPYRPDHIIDENTVEQGIRTATGVSKHQYGGTIPKYQFGSFFRTLGNGLKSVFNTAKSAAKTVVDEAGFDKENVNRMVSDLQYLGILPVNNEGYQQGIVNPVFLPSRGGTAVTRVGNAAYDVNYVTNAAERAARLDYLKSLKNLTAEEALELKMLAGSNRSVVPAGTVAEDWLYPASSVPKPKRGRPKGSKVTVKPDKKASTTLGTTGTLKTPGKAQKSERELELERDEKMQERRLTTRVRRERFKASDRLATGRGTATNQGRPPVWKFQGMEEAIMKYGGEPAKQLLRMKLKIARLNNPEIIKLRLKEYRDLVYRYAKELGFDKNR